MKARGGETGRSGQSGTMRSALKPQERLFVNGAGARVEPQRSVIELLQRRHLPEGKPCASSPRRNERTPLRQLYFVVETMLIRSRCRRPAQRGLFDDLFAAHIRFLQPITKIEIPHPTGFWICVRPIDQGPLFRRAERSCAGAGLPVKSKSIGEKPGAGPGFRRSLRDNRHDGQSEHTGPAAAVARSQNRCGSGAGAASTTMDYDAFLRLLIAEMEASGSPSILRTPSEYVSQFASFSVVEAGDPDQPQVG